MVYESRTHGDASIALEVGDLAEHWDAILSAQEATDQALQNIESVFKIAGYELGQKAKEDIVGALAGSDLPDEITRNPKSVSNLRAALVEYQDAKIVLHHANIEYYRAVSEKPGIADFITEDVLARMGEHEAELVRVSRDIPLAIQNIESHLGNAALDLASRAARGAEKFGAPAAVTLPGQVPSIPPVTRTEGLGGEGYRPDMERAIGALNTQYTEVKTRANEVQAISPGVEAHPKRIEARKVAAGLLSPASAAEELMAASGTGNREEVLAHFVTSSDPEAMRAVAAELRTMAQPQRGLGSRVLNAFGLLVNVGRDKEMLGIAGHLENAAGDIQKAVAQAAKDSLDERAIVSPSAPDRVAQTVGESGGLRESVSNMVSRVKSAARGVSSRVGEATHEAGVFAKKGMGFAAGTAVVSVGAVAALALLSGSDKRPRPSDGFADAELARRMQAAQGEGPQLG